MSRNKASLELVKRYYPDYSGPVHVYRLQTHILGKILWPLIDSYAGPEDVIVDLGCGSGSILNQLCQRAATAVGIDQDDSGFWRYPDLNLVKGSLYHLPIQANAVDLAISRWVFEHLANPEAAIAEIWRILKPKGVVLIVVPNLLHPLIMLSRVLPLRSKQWILYTLNGIKKETVLKTYYCANTEGALDRLFREAGFEKVEFIYSGDPSYWLFSSFLFRCVVRAQGLAKFQPLRRFRMVMVGLYRKGDTETQSQGASQ